MHIKRVGSGYFLRLAGTSLKFPKKLSCLFENDSLFLCNFTTLANKIIKGEGLDKKGSGGALKNFSKGGRNKVK